MSHEVLATITTAHYGVRDFPDGRSGLWFGVEWGDGWGAAINFAHDEAEQFLINNQVFDIAHLNGRQCFILDEGIGACPVQFVRMQEESAK